MSALISKLPASKSSYAIPLRMRKSFFILGCLFLLTIAACGGGGGGGGHAGAGGGGSTISKVPLSDFAGGAKEIRKANNYSEAFGQAGEKLAMRLAEPNDSTKTNSFQAYRLWMYGTYWFGLNHKTKIYANGEIIYGEHTNYLRPELNGYLEIRPADLTMFNNGLVGMAIPVPDETIRNGKDWLQSHDNSVVLFGGTSVALQYTNFGYWADTISIGGEVGGQRISGTLHDIEPFVLVADSANKAIPAIGGSPFTGKVLANAWDSSSGAFNAKVAYLVGDASLRVASASTGDITFSFPNFYTLSTNLNIGGSGGISQSGGFAISDAGKNTTDIKLLSGQSGSVIGQFYGGSGGAPATEAVGVFDYNREGTSGVSGSFGVKR